MKLFITAALYFASVLLATAQSSLSNPDVFIAPRTKSVDLIHAIMSHKDDTVSVRMDEKIGKIEQLPEVLSDSFGFAIEESNTLYDKGNFNGAVAILEEAVRSEPTNAFILEPYARALYQVRDKKALSYESYKTLIALLDSTNNSNPETIAIDMWFREAYWKLGTLYMDRGEWDKAQFEINRFLMSIQELKGSSIYNQGLEYLTECYFELGDKALYIHFANRTLKYNPGNKYASEILGKN